MSLHKFAEQVAANGRGEDSLLIHMTPDEVSRLQAFAQANGRSLTINPHTGLPEAGMLSDLFKAVAPIALGAFLGPAGAAFGGGLMSAGMAGLTVGGLTTLATGSLSRGLMAGMGAYGGAGLGAGLETAGANALTTQGVGDYAAKLAEQGLTAGTPEYGEAASKLALESQKEALAKPLTEKLSAGLGSITSSPEALGTFAKQNFAPLSAAAAPIMAAAMVPTTTQLPTGQQTPSFIRQKVWNGRGYDEVGPVDASKFGSHSFSDIYKGYAGGGIVALANGGALKMAGGTPPTMLTDEQLYQQTGDWNKAAALRDAQNNALNQYNWQQQADAANAANAAKLNTTAANYVTSAATPNETTADFISGANKAGIGLTQPLATALQNSGLSAGAQYALTHADIGPTENAAETYGGLKGLSNNINYALSQYNSNPANQLKTAEQKRAEAKAALGKDLTEADVIRATGKTINELFPTATTVTPTGVYGAYGNATGNPLTATPGDIGMNPDGTVTVTPNIPGRPEGGFPGMGAVKDAYTEGGGSLGYTAQAPKTIAEFNQMFNKQTGDSLAAYDYLMGKGGGKYPTKSTVEQIAKPYDEAVLGYPAASNKKYIFANGKYTLNPDYVPLGRDSSGNVTYGMSLKDIKSSLLNKPLEGQALYDWAKTNNLSAQQIADATGMSLSEVYAQFRAGSQAAAKTVADKAAADAAANANAQMDASSTGGQAAGGLQGYAVGGGLGSLGSYSDGGRLLKGPGDGVSDSIPATIGAKQQPARLADGEFVVPARIVSELGNGSTEAGAKKLYAMMDRVQRARGKTTGKNKVAANTRADKYLPA